MSEKNSEIVASLLEDGKIIATPTDTVWGLLIDGSNPGAVEKLFELKQRDLSKQFILFISDVKQLENYVDFIPAYANQFMEAFWPGKLTLVLRAKRKIYEDQKTLSIGVRMPTSEHILSLLRSLDKPILSTSANISGQETLVSAVAIKDIFEDAVEVWEPTTKGVIKQKEDIASTVVDAQQENTWEILREGAVCKEELWQVLDVNMKKKVGI